MESSRTGFPAGGASPHHQQYPLVFAGQQPASSPQQQQKQEELPFLRASLTGDWQAARDFLSKNKSFCVGSPITLDEDTALHIAALANKSLFVTELLKMMKAKGDIDDLKRKNKQGLTALYYAAQSGIVSMAEEMVKMNKELPSIHDEKRGETLPLYVAALLRHKEMASYLYTATHVELFSTKTHVELIKVTVDSDLYEIALEILQIYEKEEMKIRVEQLAGDLKVWIALKVLAGKPSANGRKGSKGIIFNQPSMEKLANKLVAKLLKVVASTGTGFSLDQVIPMYMDLLLEAAKVGNVEFIKIVLFENPLLIWEAEEEFGHTLFHEAILSRQKSVFDLINGIGSVKDSIAMVKEKRTDNNMLHLVGKSVPSERLDIVSGAALQLQQELLWFKEIEKIVPPSFVNMKNSDGLTPKELFRKTHKDLQKAGEQWMKDTANSCMLVATLIATVVFTAAFTVPGGNQERGIPIFLESNWFTVFFISDAIALLSSSTSILSFLSILTARYTEEEFLAVLPRRLVLGLVALFLAIVTMLVAFSATCFLVYHSKMTIVPTAIFAAASIPVLLFVRLYIPTCGDLIIAASSAVLLYCRGDTARRTLGILKKACTLLGSREKQNLQGQAQV